MPKRRFAKVLLTLSLTVPGSLLLAACPEKPPLTVAVDTLCETPRYHTTDDERAIAKANAPKMKGLFDWLAAFDVRWDKRCGQ